MYYKKGDKITAYDIAINKWYWIGGTMLNPVRYYDRKFENDIAIEFEVYDYEVWGLPLEDVGLRYSTDYKVPIFTDMLDDLLGEDSYEQLMSMMDKWNEEGVLSSRY